MVKTTWILSLCLLIVPFPARAQDVETDEAQIPSDSEKIEIVDDDAFLAASQQHDGLGSQVDDLVEDVLNKKYGTEVLQSLNDLGSVGMLISSKRLSTEEVFECPFRSFVQPGASRDLGQWVRFTIKARHSLSTGKGFEIAQLFDDGTVSPLQGHAGFSLFSHQMWTFDAKVTDLESDGFLRAMWRGLKKVPRGVKYIVTFPRSSRSAIREFLPGEMAIVEGESGSIVSSGTAMGLHRLIDHYTSWVKGNVASASVNLNPYIFQRGQKRMTLQRQSRRFFRVRHEILNGRGPGVGLGVQLATVGFSEERAKLQFVFRVLQLNRNQIDDLQNTYDFRFDITKPQARKALDDALAGNLVTAQECWQRYTEDPVDYVSIHTEDPESSDCDRPGVDYGVHQYEESTTKRTSRSQDVHSRIELQAALKVLRLNLKKRIKLPEFYQSHRSEVDAEIAVQHVNSEQKLYRYTTSGRRSRLLFLLGPKLEESAEAGTYLQHHYSEDESIAPNADYAVRPAVALTLERAKLSYSFVQKKGKPDRLAWSMTKALSEVAPERTRSFTSAMDDTRPERDIQLEVHVALYYRAIEKLLRLEPGDIWFRVGKLIGLPDAVRWRQGGAQVREEMVRDWCYDACYEDWDPRKETHRLYRDYTRLEPIASALIAAQSNGAKHEARAQAKLMRDLISKRKYDPLGVIFLSVLALVDESKSENAQSTEFADGLSLQIKLSGKGSAGQPVEHQIQIVGQNRESRVRSVNLSEFRDPFLPKP